MSASEMPTSAGPLIVIPTLNESAHIGALLDLLLVEAEVLDARIVVVDGLSTDGTQAIVEGYAARHPRVALIANPQRIQSVALNRAVAQFGDDHRFVIRVDAHGTYPHDYCRALIAEAEVTGADSVVVPLHTVGQNTFQRAVATAQNSLVGTGGSPHRTGKSGRWVEHGHHALMTVTAFRAVGGYDEGFRHNEDAEMDFRLGEAGYRIWLTAETHMIYYPRSTAPALFRQYLGYGRGRAKNIFKHRSRPRLRQFVPVLVVPAVGIGALVAFNWLTIVPATLWLIASMSLGALATARHENYGLPLRSSPLVGVTAMIMHFAWSAGFWLHVAETVVRGRRSA
jgi:succinoglycan biosynthesis protein ExoA